MFQNLSFNKYDLLRPLAVWILDIRNAASCEHFVNFARVEELIFPSIPLSNAFNIFNRLSLNVYLNERPGVWLSQARRQVFHK